MASHTKLTLSCHPFLINVHKAWPLESTQQSYIALSSAMTVSCNTSVSVCVNQRPLHPTRKPSKRMCWLL